MVEDNWLVQLSGHEAKTQDLDVVVEGSLVGPRKFESLSLGVPALI